MVVPDPLDLTPLGLSDQLSTPRHKGHGTYALFFFLGMGLLFPWNAFITAVDYFESKYPGMHTDRLFTVCYLPVNLVVVMLMIHLHDVVRPRLRVMLGFAGFFISVLSVPLLDMTNTSQSTLLLGLTLLFVGITGACDGFAQAALFGETAILPQRYTQALVAGTAASGVAVSLLRIITKAALPKTDEGLLISAEIYFYVCGLVCLVCLLLYGWLLPHLPVLQYYRPKAVASAIKEAGSGEQEYAAVVQVSGSSLNRDKPDSGVAAAQACEEGKEEELVEQHLLGDRSARTYVQVGRSIWRLAMANMAIYVITLSIFPGVLAEDVRSKELGDWYPVLLIAGFNVADLVGKCMPVLPSLICTNASAILWSAVLRVTFIPAFHFAVTDEQGTPAVVLLTLALGLTNGYLTAVSMMAAPQGLRGYEAQIAGNIMVLFLIGGLCLGAALGFLWLL